jgi:hypothetical protein
MSPALRLTQLPQFYESFRSAARTRIAPLCRPVVCSRSNLSEEAGLADVIFLAVGAGAFAVFALLATALKRV